MYLKVVNINSVDLNEAYFHFTLKSNLPNIEELGLKASIGDASNLVNDKARMCLCKGGKGLLGIKDSFFIEFMELRICDIPLSYRKYFDISDFNSTSKISKDQVYDAFEKRFLDEVYLLVDAVKGEDYLEDEVYGFSTEFDIKGIENHDISIEKLSLITSEIGSSALDIIRYVYDRLLEVIPRESVKDFLGYLDEFLEYLDNKRNLGGMSR